MTNIAIPDKSPFGISHVSADRNLLITNQYKLIDLKEEQISLNISISCIHYWPPEQCWRHHHYYASSHYSLQQLLR